MADTEHHIEFTATEEVLHEHERRRSPKLKRADEHFTVESGEDPQCQNPKVSPLDNKSMGHVGFETPEDILQPHEEARPSAYKLGDEPYLPSEDVASPHVGFMETEHALREHDLPRSLGLKKGDESGATTPPVALALSPDTVTRLQFTTPEDILQKHDSPRAPALKLADENFVQTDDTFSSPMLPNIKPFSNPSDGPSDPSTPKSAVPTLWHKSLVAGGLRTLAASCTSLDAADWDRRGAEARRVYFRLAPAQVGLDTVGACLDECRGMGGLRQAARKLVAELTEALQEAGSARPLSPADFGALLLTLGALSAEADWQAFLQEVEASLKA